VVYKSRKRKSGSYDLKEAIEKEEKDKTIYIGEKEGVKITGTGKKSKRR
jgi:hypothetical protein